MMSARIDDASVLPHARSADEAAAPALIVTPAKAGVHAGTGTVVERWTPAFAGEAFDIVCRHEPPCFLLGALTR